MQRIEKNYINGKFVTPKGNEVFKIVSPVTNQPIGQVMLADESDTRDAVAAAKKAFKTFSVTTREQRINYLQKLKTEINARKDDLTNAMILEYGGTKQFSTNISDLCSHAIDSNIEVLKNFEFIRTEGNTAVELTPIGVVGIITPWNASNYYLANKISTALAAGCTVVVKPSEMSAIQTQVFAECVQNAGFPDGVVNIVIGLGTVVGAELTRNPDVRKISFTGSTVVGKTIARDGADTMKRITLELGGKSPNIILPDADLATAVPFSLIAGYMNSGQACIAATRLLVHEDSLQQVRRMIVDSMENIKVGLPANEDTQIGPMISVKQYERVQEYIRIGIEEGAEVLIGGLGKPAGLEDGNFVKPTVFVNVFNTMRIAREEIFGPVISIITYKTIEEAIEIANDSPYGLNAYVQGSNLDEARRIASQLESGTVCINGFKHDPFAPFGGFKLSGLGRESGTFGLQAHLEPKSILA